jgi:hypothetical protein
MPIFLFRSKAQAEPSLAFVTPPPSKKPTLASNFSGQTSNINSALPSATISDENLEDIPLTDPPNDKDKHMLSESPIDNYGKIFERAARNSSVADTGIGSGKRLKKVLGILSKKKKPVSMDNMQELKPQKRSKKFGASTQISNPLNGSTGVRTLHFMENIGKQINQEEDKDVEFDSDEEEEDLHQIPGLAEDHSQMQQSFQQHCEASKDFVPLDFVISEDSNLGIALDEKETIVSAADAGELVMISSGKQAPVRTSYDDLDLIPNRKTSAIVIQVQNDLSSVPASFEMISESREEKFEKTNGSPKGLNAFQSREEQRKSRSSSRSRAISSPRNVSSLVEKYQKANFLIVMPVNVSKENTKARMMSAPVIKPVHSDTSSERNNNSVPNAISAIKKQEEKSAQGILNSSFSDSKETLEDTEKLKIARPSTNQLQKEQAKSKSLKQVSSKAAFSQSNPEELLGYGRVSDTPLPDPSIMPGAFSPPPNVRIPRSDSVTSGSLPPDAIRPSAFPPPPNVVDESFEMSYNSIASEMIAFNVSDVSRDSHESDIPEEFVDQAAMKDVSIRNVERSLQLEALNEADDVEEKGHKTEESQFNTSLSFQRVALETHDTIKEETSNVAVNVPIVETSVTGVAHIESNIKALPKRESGKLGMSFQRSRAASSITGPPPLLPSHTGLDVKAFAASLLISESGTSDERNRNQTVFTLPSESQDSLETKTEACLKAD